MKTKCSLKFISLTLLVLQIANPFSAFAKSDFVENDFCEEYYWTEIKGINLDDNNGFSGVVKYICDEENGAFYLYFSFYDKNLNSQSSDKITIGITIENENSKHLICIDENGYTNDSSVDAEDTAKIYYSFDQASAIRKGGTLFVGFELKKSTDKQVKNYITCDYYFGDYIIHNLLTDIVLDMSKNTTTKKQSSTAASSYSAEEVYNEDSVSNKNNSQTDESTKFAGSGKYIQNDTGETEKYEPNKNANSDNDSDTAHSNEISEKYQPNSAEESTESQIQAYDYSSQHSQSTKIIAGVGAGLVAVGMICTAAGILTRKKRTSNTIPKEE